MLSALEKVKDATERYQLFKECELVADHESWQDTSISKIEA